MGAAPNPHPLMHFSDLTVDFPGTTNRLYRHLEKLRQSGTSIIDLISANVNDHGIVFPEKLLSEILTEAVKHAVEYKPDSLGQSVAREAISTYTDVPAKHILLTPGTSLSYWYAFKLLCEPGSEVLCPTPSYPLLNYITRLAEIELNTYKLNEQKDWSVDMDQIEQQISEQTRAIVLISPHNPTGMVSSQSQINELCRIAAKHNLPLIFDEVFREFVRDGIEPIRPTNPDVPLVFTLNGFSKMFALPGIKIGWMTVSGEEKLVRKAIRTLELISDTFLPVNEVAQFAVPNIFAKGHSFLHRYRNEINKRRQAAVTALGPVIEVPPEGGFHFVVQFKRDIGEEDLAIELLDSEHILVHPGYFYDIEGQHIVMSVVNQKTTLNDALIRVRQHL